MTIASADRPANAAAPDVSPSDAAPLITVAICTRNRAGFLEKAVNSVLPQITGDTEILIVENASTDGTPEVAARLSAAHPRVRVCREDEVGLSAARNTALREARGRYVLFLDDDAVAEPGWLTGYQRFFAAPPSDRIAVVGGAVFPDYEIPAPKWFGAQINQWNLGELARRVSARGGPWGCNCAYLRDVALRAGMFDAHLGRKGESLGAHEESDLNQRLQNAGYEIWWLPGAGIRHFIAADRLNFRWVSRAIFSEGRSSTVMRLTSMNSRWRRALFRSGRSVVAPFHILVCLVAALVTLPLRRGQAAGYLLRAVRIAGITCEALWHRAPRAGRPCVPRQ